MSTKQILEEIHERLSKHFGPQHWWPAQEPFEVMVGAILTQNTNWTNVAKAIINLKQAKLLTPQNIYELNISRLAELIKPAGYFNIKAQRLKNFVQWFYGSYQGNIDRLINQDHQSLRQQLLDIKGIGPETADSMLLYALQKPAFVVDTYTYRILSRHEVIQDETTYEELQTLFHDNLRNDVPLFNEYHALIVRTGKEYCKKSNYKCNDCPLNGINNYPN
jgi:endonuclease III related protein